MINTKYSLEQIIQELDKIATLKCYHLVATNDSFQVYDKRTDDLIIDADFKTTLMENLTDALFGWGSLYEYLLKRM